MVGKKSLERHDTQEKGGEAGLHEYLSAAIDCCSPEKSGECVMEKVQVILLSLLFSLTAYGQRYEKVPFGDFEQWAVRYITESKVIGGEERTVYMIGPTDTIRGNVPYSYDKTIWSSSNVYAKIAGVTKTSNNVMPDDGPTGKCAKLVSQMAACKVAGLVNLKVLATGSIYWGETQEPVSNVTNPYAVMSWGVPFTKRPKAMLLNYKAEIPNTGKLVRSTTFRYSEFEGYDPFEFVFILQNRWEDADGNIHAVRVGTAVCRVEESSDGWVMDFRMPIIYGDARKSETYQPYMDLISGYKNMYAINSKGKKKLVLEEDWADANTPVTHAIMWFSSGSCGAFIGALDNILWLDELRLEY